MVQGLNYQKRRILNNSIRGKCSLSICYSLRTMDCPFHPHSSPQIHFPDGETESQLARGHGAARQLAWSQWLSSSLLLCYAVCSKDRYCRCPAPSTTQAAFLMPEHWTAAHWEPLLLFSLPRQPAGPAQPQNLRNTLLRKLLLTLATSLRH